MTRALKAIIRLCTASLVALFITFVIIFTIILILGHLIHAMWLAHVLP